MLRRAIARATTSVLGLILLAPLLTLVPAAVLDIGPAPEARARFSVFPLALAALDPLIWTSLWNSVAVAVIVAAGSLVIGVGLGAMVARRRFWGRPVLSAMITAPAVVAPALLALGLLDLFDRSGPRAPGSLLGSLASAHGFSARVWPWLVWGWAAMIQGVALVAVTTGAAHGRLQPLGEDAARLAGAGPERIWWTLTWPNLRPSVAAAVYLVFMINLADPGPPLVIGLRRTLGFQMVATALGPEPFPRLAAIALFVLTITLAGHTLVSWFRGSRIDPDLSAGGDRDWHDRRTQVAAWPRAAVSFLILACWSLLAWLPVAGLVRMGLARTSYPDNPHPLARLGIVDLLMRLTTDPAPRLLAHTTLLGAGAVALLCLLAWLPARGPVGSQVRGWRGAVAFLNALAPPLVVGAGVLALCRMAMVTSRFFVAGLDWTVAGLWMESIALALDPYRFPGLLLFVGACLASLPRRLTSRPKQSGRDAAIARLADQARLSAAGRGRARRHACRGVRAIPLPLMFLWGALAATAITPALVLAPTLESRPVGPGIVVLGDQPDDSRALAAALALAAIALDLAALGWAAARPCRDGCLEAADLA